MKAVVAAFNQEKALEEAFSVITNLRMELFEALVCRGTPAPPPVVPEDGALGVEETLPAAARRHAHQLAPVQQRREVHLAVAAHPAVRHAGGVFEIVLQ